MNEVDKDRLGEHEDIDDHEMLLREVIKDDHELYYLHCFLGECLGKETLG